MRAIGRLPLAEARLLDFGSQERFGRKVKLLPGAVWSLLVVWQQRASQRTHLARLERNYLEDMGITPEQARKEAAKPFWRP
ncbi:MAG: DUF1127 domain-containing protein [Pseudomonadota bacterium]